jgi:hypothetical protein
MKPNVALGKDNLALISFYFKGISTAKKII